MILSLGLILLGGFLIGVLFEKIKIPKIVGMILLGILLGPSVLNIIDPSLMTISPYLRQIALVIILTRSGLSLDLKKLKEVGRPAILMCFVPATFEIIGVAIFAPMLLGLTLFEALLLGSVLGAVSPAIVVPRMIRLQKEKYGEKNHIPELIMAGASMDDIYVIVLFYSFLGLVSGTEISVWSIAQIPISIILGITLGLIVGFILSLIFKKAKVSYVVKIIILLGISFLMIGFEEILQPYISLSALISIIVVGIILLLRNKEDAKEIENGYKGLWKVFEIILFVLVGISVDLDYAFSAGFMPLLVLLIGLLFRMMGVLVCLLFTKLTFKERLFTMFSYLPKATVQASIGGIALSIGLQCGPLVLTVSVLSILITAPLGAILMDSTYLKLIPNSQI